MNQLIFENMASFYYGIPLNNSISRIGFHPGDEKDALFGPFGPGGKVYEATIKHDDGAWIQG